MGGRLRSRIGSPGAGPPGAGPPGAGPPGHVAASAWWSHPAQRSDRPGVPGWPPRRAPVSWPGWGSRTRGSCG